MPVIDSAKQRWPQQPAVSVWPSLTPSLQNILLTDATYGHNDVDGQNSLSTDHGQVIDSVQMVRTRAAAQTDGRETETDTETDDDGRMTADVGSDAELSNIWPLNGRPPTPV